MKTNYEALATRYAKHRSIHPEVLAALTATLDQTARVLEVGCGTGNYICAVGELIGCDCVGLEPSAAMLQELQRRGCLVQSVQGAAEKLELPDQSFDLVFSVDAVHHFVDRVAAFGEAFRVLKTGGHICTVTDSEWIIRHRVPLASHFPETVDVELVRYPSIDTLLFEMRRAGFDSPVQQMVEHSYDLTNACAYRDKVFSSLLGISEEAFQRGLGRLQADLELGPLRCVSRYCLVWGTKTRRVRKKQ
jgi:ubiquinone/menaquinone biosynthesis C-methylase UbiE